MIDKAAERMTEILNHPDIIAELAGDKVSWEIASDSMEYPYVNFDVYDEGNVTKNAAAKTFGKVRVYDESMFTAAKISTVIRNTVRDNFNKVYDRGAKSGYTSVDPLEAAVEITFEFKI